MVKERRILTLSARLISNSNFPTTPISVMRELIFQLQVVYREALTVINFRFKNFVAPNLKSKRRTKRKHLILSKNRQKFRLKQNILPAADLQTPIQIGRFAPRRQITRRRIAEILRSELSFRGGDIITTTNIQIRPFKHLKV